MDNTQSKQNQDTGVGTFNICEENFKHCIHSTSIKFNIHNKPNIIRRILQFLIFGIRYE